MFYIKPGSISYATNRQIRLFNNWSNSKDVELFKSTILNFDLGGKDNIVFKKVKVWVTQLTRRLMQCAEIVKMLTGTKMSTARMDKWTAAGFLQWNIV